MRSMRRQRFDLAPFAYTGGPVAGANPNVAAATAAYTALMSIFTDPAWQTPIDRVTGTGTNKSNTALANKIIIPELKSFFSEQLESLGMKPVTASSLSNLASLGASKLGGTIPGAAPGPVRAPAWAIPLASPPPRRWTRRPRPVRRRPARLQRFSMACHRMFRPAPGRFRAFTCRPAQRADDRRCSRPGAALPQPA